MFQLEAEQMMEQLIYWVQVDPSGLGRPQLPGEVPINSLSVPMMLMCLVQQLTEGRGQEVAQKYKELGNWCVEQILQHIQVWTQTILCCFFCHSCIFYQVPSIHKYSYFSFSSSASFNAESWHSYLRERVSGWI